MKRPSLSRQAIIYLAASQFVAFLLGSLLTIGLGLAGVEPWALSWDELAFERTSALVIGSLVRDDAGHIRISPSNALNAEQKRAPLLRYAAFEFSNNQALQGSSPELIERLRNVLEVSATHTHFVMAGDPPSPALGFMEPRWTRFGRLHVAVYRQKFRWDDMFHSIFDIFRELPVYFVATVISAATASLVVRHALTPVRVAANKAAQIDMNSLDQRLPSEEVPEEIGPLVDAINTTLARLDAGVEQQRRFTANAAHELRTPLAVLRARLDNAKPSALRADLLGDAAKLQSIVDEILVAARLSAGQLQLVQTVDVSATVERAVGSLMKLAMNRNRCIEFVPSSTQAPVQGNERAIECVVSNLVDNALRAEPEHGLVEVRVEGTTVSVIDHGAGVAPEDRERIFEPFWRKSDSTPGAGLGLAIAKEIMDAHGGRIWVEDTPGGGATFYIRLRISESSFEDRG